MYMSVNNVKSDVRLCASTDGIVTWVAALGTVSSPDIISKSAPLLAAPTCPSSKGVVPFAYPSCWDRKIK